jgi:hypothetical protein
MASILLALFYCGRSTIMAFKNKDNDALPSEKREKDPHGETLREKAAKKIHGKGSNPSQLGDPISLKAETSDTVPTDGEEGSRQKEGGSSDGGSTSGRERDAAANREKRTSKI